MWQSVIVDVMSCMMYVYLPQIRREQEGIQTRLWQSVIVDVLCCVVLCRFAASPDQKPDPEFYLKVLPDESTHELVSPGSHLATTHGKV